ncbi:hypothetical protein ASD28_12570 [Massilia sp. Root133]|uniref:hypothetical protein n=1 Tax=Massilia sp. Root133 TaxID=1736455 RepID=UPI0006FB8D4A|nr:hypothetical protein [Massilia sp. Root133]KQY00158.1 hypothetical protein ASD28_12570 [Massilia sp. Root133]
MKSNHNNLAPARVTTDEFKFFCDAQNLHWLITWKWQGRNRAGVLKVYDRDDNLKARVLYGRSTQMWGPADQGLDRVRTGSPKHFAVLEAQKMLELPNKPLSNIKTNKSDC